MSSTIQGILVVMKRRRFIFSWRKQRAASCEQFEPRDAKLFLILFLAGFFPLLASAQFIDIAVSNAVNAISASTLGSTYPGWDSMASSGSVVTTDILSGWPSNEIPRALWDSASAVANNCRWVNATAVSDGKVLTGRVAYVVVNCSGLLDANYVGGSPQTFSRTNVNELDLSSLPDIVDTNLFFADRATQSPYSSLSDLTNRNAGVAKPVSDIFWYSYDPGRDLMYMDVSKLGQADIQLQPKFNINSITNTPEWQASYDFEFRGGSAINQDAYTNASVAFTSYYWKVVQYLEGAAVDGFPATGSQYPYPEIYYDIGANLIGYLDPDRIPQIVPITSRPYAWQVHQGSEDTPLINEVVLQRVYPVSNIYEFAIELWFPFYPGTVELAEAFFLEVSIYDYAANVSSNLPAGNTNWSFTTNILRMSFYNFDGTHPQFLVFLSPADKQIKRDITTSPVYFVAQVKKQQGGQTYIVDQAMSRTTATPFNSEHGYAVNDPRWNGQSKFWQTAAGWQGRDYPASDNTLGVMNTNCMAWTRKGQGLPIYHRNGPMETIGELGHISVGTLNDVPVDPQEYYWQTIDILNWNWGAYLLDRMTIRETDAVTPMHGLVNINTPETNVLLTLFDNLGIGATNPAGEYQQTLSTDDPEVQDLVATIMTNSARPYCSFQSLFTNTAEWDGGEMARKFRACAKADSDGHTNEIQRQDVLRKVVDLITFRQNIFSVIAVAQRLKPDGITVQSEERAMTTVFRDAYTGQSQIITNWYFSLDADCDTIPDWWERNYSSGPTNISPSADDDGDRMNNLSEYLADTDPADSNSLLRIIDVTQDGTNAPVIRWSSASDKRYGLIRSTNLLRGFDAAVHSNILAVTPANTATDTTATGTGPYFYRVKLE